MCVCVCVCVCVYIDIYVYNQDLVISQKKLSTLFLFISEMEKKTYNYLTKNISIPSERNYKLQLIEKIEIFLKIMRWKAIMYDAGCKENREVEKYGLKNIAFPKTSQRTFCI